MSNQGTSGWRSRKACITGMACSTAETGHVEPHERPISMKLQCAEAFTANGHALPGFRVAQGPAT